MSYPPEVRYCSAFALRNLDMVVVLVLVLVGW
jgi:hypothetical protein